MADSAWATYIFQYIVGGIVFVFGLWVCMRSGDVRYANADDRGFFWILIAGFALYLAAHGLWMWIGGFS